MLSDILELIKFRILLSSLFTTVLGYFLSLSSFTLISFSSLFILLIGCTFVFSASAALNHYLERDVDALMERTKNRPLVRSRLSLRFVFLFSFVALFIGLFVLWFFFRPLVFLTTLLVFVLYVFIYTPLKRLHSSNTLIGAFPGAMPFLCGWFANESTLTLFSCLIFSIFYFWQLPHFYAIAWMNKASYENAKLQMVSNFDDNGVRTTRYLVTTTVVFLIITILPVCYSYLSWIYLFSVLLLGAYLLLTVKCFIQEKSVSNARKVLRATIFYPPVLLLFILLDLIWM